MNNYINRLNDLKNSTFGLEIEAAYMDRSTDLVGEGTWCKKEGSIIHRDTGIGNDPRGIYNGFGGEVQVTPTNSEQDLISRTLKILKMTQCPEIDMPSTMHSHIRIPELHEKENLDIVKHLILYSQKWWKPLMEIVSPLPTLDEIKENFSYDKNHLKMMTKEYKDKYRSRHSIYSEKQIARFIEKDTLEDLIDNMTVFNPNTKKPIWNIYNRTGLNFAKMRFSTIEFRCFSASSDPAIIKNIVEFPRLFILCALNNQNPVEYFKSKDWPSYYNWTTWGKDQCDMWINTNACKNKRKDIIKYLKEKLLNHEISLKDLNYSSFWEKELGDDFQKISSK